MDDKQKKLNALSEAMQRKIILLLSGKPTGKIELTVELNISQGFLGEVFLQTKPVSRERINFNEIK
jgi:hypothetical protein